MHTHTHMGGRNDMCRSSCGTTFHAKYWLSLDLCGILGIAVSWAVHLFALLVNATQLISNSVMAQFTFYVLYLPVASLAMISLFFAWTTNPGAVPLGARPLVTFRRAAAAAASEDSHGQRRRAVRRCHKCQDNYKPPRAHHDSVTGRCIVKFDH
jgi:palmitoyltransferase ZDHHC3/7/25